MPGSQSPHWTKSRPHTRPVAPTAAWLIFPALLLPLIFSSSWQTPDKFRSTKSWRFGMGKNIPLLIVCSWGRCHLVKVSIFFHQSIGLSNSACFLCRANGTSHLTAQEERCLVSMGWPPSNPSSLSPQEGFLAITISSGLFPLLFL